MSLILVSFFILTQTGCASSGQTTLLGNGLGTIAGMGIGALADAGPRGRGRVQNVFVGGTIGALLGGILGLVLHKPLAGKDPESSSRAPQDPSPLAPSANQSGNVSHPVLVPPKVQSKFVDDQIRGNIFVPGHVEYQITEPTRWSR